MTQQALSWHTNHARLLSQHQYIMAANVTASAHAWVIAIAIVMVSVIATRMSPLQNILNFGANIISSNSASQVLGALFQKTGSPGA